MVTINATNSVASNNANAFNSIRTIEVADFKEEMGVKSIQIVRSPKTGKLFFSWGAGKNGIVSTRGKGDNGAIVDPVISEMAEKDSNDNPIYMLHERGNSGANVLQTL